MKVVKAWAIVDDRGELMSGWTGVKLIYGRKSGIDTRNRNVVRVEIRAVKPKKRRPRK